jgi:zinc transport system ATP-binding protein
MLREAGVMLTVPRTDKPQGTAAGANGASAHLEADVLAAASGVSLVLHGKTVLDRVSIAVHPSEIVTLIGPNGAGKTTLARILLGLVKPSSGTVSRREGLRVGYVPQRCVSDWIIPLSVRRFMSLTQSVSRARADECLDETGAAHLADAQMGELSGGEFQRVALARALARDPHLLVLDEPAQAVDFGGAARLYELIAAIRHRRGCGILLISHDLQVVLGASDRVICLNRHICCEGVPQAVAGHPEYVRLFGPEAARSFGLYEHHHDHAHTLSGDVACGD